MLTKGDDFPLHQTPEPIAYAGTDRNFYDRYFFNGYAPDGSGFFAVAFGVYPHLNVADAHFSVIRDAYGAPQIVTTQDADIVLGRYLVERIQISLTHSATAACAVALRVPRPISPGAAGRFIFRWLPYRRQVILENLNRVYGGRVTQDQITRLAQAHYQHLFTLFKELVSFRFMSDNRKMKLVTVEGADALIRAFVAK